MNKNYTPGPWDFWSGYNALDQIEAEITAQDGDVVVAQYNSLIEQGEFNARLIAAAPDLLEALQYLVSDITERFDVENPSTNPGIKYAVEAAQKAIAKAEGEIE